MSTLYVNNIEEKDSGSKITLGNTLKVDSIEPKTTGGIINAKGMIIQVIVGGITARFVGTVSQSYEDVPSLNAITPQNINNKILVTLSGGLGNTAAGNATLLRLYRGSTNIGNGTGGSNASYRFWTGAIGDEAYRLAPFSIQYLDSPSSTSALTYKIQMAAFNANGTIGGRGDDTNYTMPTVLTLMEIGG